jgi:hypothetical protein
VTKREAFPTWESLLPVAMVLLIGFWMRSGIKSAMKKLKCKIGLGKITMPLGFVVLFFVGNGLI